MDARRVDSFCCNFASPIGLFFIFYKIYIYRLRMYTYISLGVVGFLILINCVSFVYNIYYVAPSLLTPFY